MADETEETSGAVSEDWRKTGRCSSCTFFMADFGEPPELYGHCKMHPRTGAREATDWACPEYRPLPGFDELARETEWTPEAEASRRSSGHELVRRLQEYERFKTAAEGLEALPRVGRDIHVARARPPAENAAIPQPQPGIDELLLALRDALMRADLFASHQVTREPLSVRECMSRVLARLSTGAPSAFTGLLDPEEGRSGVVVTFLAVLELVKHGLIELEQDAPYAPVRLRVSTARETP